MWGDKEEERRSTAGRSAEEAAGVSRDDPSTGLSTEEKKLVRLHFYFLSFSVGKKAEREMLTEDESGKAGLAKLATVGHPTKKP